MGICTSCFRRRRRHARDFYGYDNEREPLLHQKEDRQGYWASRTRKALECVDALKAGKLPSQDQLEVLVKKVLRSELLRESRNRKLSVAGRGVVGSLRELGKALIEFGEDKNYDNKIQNIVYNIRQLRTLIPSSQLSTETHVEVSAQEVSSDIAALVTSTESLIQLLITSATFRLLVSNLILLTRQVLAHLARDVEHVAEAAETIAQGVENAAEGVEMVAQSIEKAADRVANAVADAQPSNASGLEEVKDAVGSTVNEIRQVELDKPQPRSDKGKQREMEQHVADKATIAINSIRDILVEAHKNPEHLAALRTILTLCEKYFERAHRGVSSIHNSPLSTSPLQSPSSPSTRPLGLTAPVPNSPTPIEITPNLPTSLRPPPIPASTTSPPKSRAEVLLDNILSDVKALIERLAGGRSLDPLINAFGGVVSDMQASFAQSIDQVEEGVKSKVDDDELLQLRSFLSSLDNVVRKSLYEDPEVYLISPPRSPSDTPFSATPSSFGASYAGVLKGEVEMSGEAPMIKDVRGLLREWNSITISSQRRTQPNKDSSHDSPIPTHLQSNLDILVRETSTVIHALENDHVTLRLIRTLQGLEIYIQEYIAQFANDVGETVHQGKSKAQDVFYTLWTDIIGFVIPRVVGSVLSSTFKADSGVPVPLPLPRVEFKSPSVEGVIDPRGMTIFLDQDEGDHEAYEEEYWWGRRASMLSPDESSMSQSQSLSSSALSVNSGGEVQAYREDGESDEVERTKGTLADLLTPRSILVKRWSETRVDFGAVEEAVAVDERTPLLADTTQTRTTQVQAMDRIRVSIDGLLTSTYYPRSTRSRSLTLELDNIAFYVKYTLLRILGYEDEGVANLDLDFALGQDEESGAQIDMELQVDYDSFSGSSSRPLEIQADNIQVRLPSSAITLAVHPNIAHSQRHPIVTALLVNPTLWIIYLVSSYWARRKIEVFLGDVLKIGIEGSAKVMTDVWIAAHRKAQTKLDAKEAENEDKTPTPTLADWYESFVDVLRQFGASNGEQPNTEVDVNLKGVKVTIPEDNGNDNMEVTVGPVPQLLPRHAEPELPTADEVVEGVTEGVREGAIKVANDARETAEAGIAAAQERSKAVMEAVEGVAIGVNHVQKKETVKEKRVRYSIVEPPRRREPEGWRSNAFDF